MFTKATKKQSKLRLALIGIAGTGKTYTALSLAKHLGQRIAVIDTERGSASKYSGKGGFEFDVLELESFSPQRYIESIESASRAGYDVLIIDSLSHAWMGKDGLLEQVDKKTATMKTPNSYAAWREATPLHHKLIDSILTSPLHLIATMRAKTEYSQEKDEKGKTVIRKVGMQAIQREGLEYEFDVVADLDQDHNLIVTKTRCPALAGAVINKAGERVANTLLEWLSDGVEAPSILPPTIGLARAEKMRGELEKLGFRGSRQLALASDALTRTVERLEELSDEEAKEVWKLAKTVVNEKAAA
jgi:AAA domain